MNKKIGKLLTWCFTLDRWKKRAVQITFDTATIPSSLLLAFVARLEHLKFFNSLDLYIGILIVLTSGLFVFSKRSLYSTFTRHVSIEAAITIILGSLISGGFLFFTILIFELQIPRSVPLIYAALLCIFAASVRFFLRALGQASIKNERENVAIYGAGATGTQLMEALKWDPKYHVRQFIDDKPELHGQTLSGIPIKDFDDFKRTINSLKIDILLLATPNAVIESRKKVLSLLSERPLKVKAIPSISSLISNSSNIEEIQGLDIEDLLGREPVKPDTKLMEKNISGKTVIVTGAGGSIGRELCRQIMQWAPSELILLDVSEFATYELVMELNAHKPKSCSKIIPLIGSVQDRNFIKKVMDKFLIDTVYHAAAYKHVPLMEQNVMQCIANNVIGTLNMAETAIKANVENFILVSTDKAVNPTSYMGASKRLAEIICQTLNQRSEQTCISIVRFGNVLGSSGSVVPLFKQQIKNGGPVTLTHKDVTRYFMTIPEAVQLVIQAGSIAKGGEVFVLDMGPPIKIQDLAKKMIALSGFRPVYSEKKLLTVNDIFIKLTGLRPGEKLHEELSYKGNLQGTAHPHIMTTAERAMSYTNLKNLLSRLCNAIDNDDYKSLVAIVSSITVDVSDLKLSKDIFIRKDSNGV